MYIFNGIFSMITWYQVQIDANILRPFWQLRQLSLVHCLYCLIHRCPMTEVSVMVIQQNNCIDLAWETHRAMESWLVSWERERERRGEGGKFVIAFLAISINTPLLFSKWQQSAIFVARYSLKSIGTFLPGRSTATSNT